MTSLKTHQLESFRRTSATSIDCDLLNYSASRPDSREVRKRFEESPGSIGQSAR